LLLFVAAVLVVRRNLGGLTLPLSASSLFVCGLAVAAASIIFRLLNRESPASEPLQTVWRAAPIIAVVLIASSLSIPGTGAGGLFALWICIALGEITSQFIAPSQSQRVDAANLAASLTPARAESPPDNLSRPTADNGAIQHDAADVSQRLTRRRDENGRELISGWLRVDVSPGERTKFAHVAFCPPLSRAPHCEIELEDGLATATVAQVLPQGARFELKLPRPATESTTISLEWVAYETDSI
jgi:hypothetical protein